MQTQPTHPQQAPSRSLLHAASCWGAGRPVSCTLGSPAALMTRERAGRPATATLLRAVSLLSAFARERRAILVVLCRCGTNSLIDRFKETQHLLLRGPKCSADAKDLNLKRKIGEEESEKL